MPGRATISALNRQRGKTAEIGTWSHSGDKELSSCCRFVSFKKATIVAGSGSLYSQPYRV